MERRPVVELNSPPTNIRTHSGHTYAEFWMEDQEGFGGGGGWVMFWDHPTIPEAWVNHTHWVAPPARQTRLQFTLSDSPDTLVWPHPRAQAGIVL